ncbi:MAG: methyltransferase domain-containing protein [candidate division NC10 bacterium]|nr:methyltransferase domain-containing protein [candidate division NC10 bacterium]
MNPRDVDAVIQAVRFQLYRENIYGALDLLERVQAEHPDPRYGEQAARIRSWLTHLESRAAYVDAQEAQYRRLRWKAGLKLLEKRIRILLGRKTRKMIDRRAADPEFQELEREVALVRPRRVLDAGSGEGGVAMALGARHPELSVEGVEVSATNTKLATLLNRFPNVGFRQGLAEEVHLHFPPASFDLVYSLAVLEHVRDVDATLAAIETVLRPGGRFAFVVPMHELRATGPIPDYTPIHGYADHCRVFTEAELRERFAHRPGFRLVKLPGEWKHGELPDCFEPVEFGAFFVSYAPDA